MLEESQKAMRKSDAVSYLKKLSKKTPEIIALLDDISWLERHENHWTECKEKYLSEIESTKSGDVLVVTVDYKSNTEVPKWRGDVFDSYSPPTLGIFGMKINFKGEVTFVDVITPVLSHSSEYANYLLDFGMREYFSAKGIQMITLNKVSVWSDCARHFRCGAFIFSSLSFLEGSFMLSKVRTVNFFTEHHGVTCCPRTKAYERMSLPKGWPVCLFAVCFVK